MLLVQESVFKEFVAMLKSKINKLQIDCDSMVKSLDIVRPLLSCEHDAEHFKGLPVTIGNKEFGTEVISTENLEGERLHIIPFRTANEAAALANNSPYGFATSVWTENISLANEMTAKLKVALHHYISTVTESTNTQLLTDGHCLDKHTRTHNV